MHHLTKFILAAAWIGSIAFVFQLWMNHEHNPGMVGEMLPQWPADSRLKSDEKHGTLVVFLHPYCPCSRKGMKKIERILAAQANDPTCYFVFSPWPDKNYDATDSENWRIAQSLCREGTQIDSDAAECTRFGARTSGFVVFYDAARRLRFSGGITSERGGEEANSFERLLAEALAGTEFPLINTPVFGCPLVQPQMN